MTIRALLKRGLQPPLVPLRRVRARRQRRDILREQMRCIHAREPVPFHYQGDSLHIAPDDDALRHIELSTSKIARLAALVPESSAVVLDVGAHSGLFSRFVQRRCPSARVIAFEPNGDLRRISSLNCMPGTTVVDAAVGARSGHVTLFVNQRSGQTSSAVQDVAAVFAARDTMQVREVPVITIDEYCATHGIATVDAMKVDVQGYERDVIEGAQAILPTVRMLLLEATFLDIASVQLVLDLRSRFRYAYAVNDVYLGGDLALTNEPLIGAGSHIVQMW